MKNVLNMREISRALTGSPNKIRADFVPVKYRYLMTVLQGVVESLIDDFKKEENE